MAQPPAAYLEWTPEMLLGVDAFDREHRELVETINRLHRLLQQAAPEGQLVVEVERLIEQAERHFSHEEQVLRWHGCPNLRLHQREHDELLEDVRALRLVTGDVVAAGDVMRMLGDWLVDHIVNFDRPYRGYLDGKPLPEDGGGPG
ncbi:MAG TPA: bacteriohemerythrin [Gammaproteobacteria bacterium]